MLGWKMSNGQEAGPLGLDTMAPFIEHLVNPRKVPRIFSTLPHLCVTYNLMSDILGVLIS